MLKACYFKLLNGSRFYLDKFNKSVLEGIQWGGKGFRSFYLNLKSTNAILCRRALGHPLTYNEKNIVRTTITDTLKLIPLSFFFIVPFAEFGIPIALKLFPNMLPSTFTYSHFDEKKIRNLQLKKKEISEFNSQIKSLISKLSLSTDSNISSAAKKIQEVEKKILNQNYDRNDIKEIFNESIRKKLEIENLDLSMLQSISKLMDLYPIRNKCFLSLKIRYKFLKINREDKEILWNIAENIDRERQVKIMLSRFIDPLKINSTTTYFKDSFLDWIELSSINEIPLPIVLWIQTTKLEGLS